MPLLIIPSALLRWRILDPMLYATQGSIDGSCMALEKGWAINLSGGYHHAHLSGGGGFCVYPDITITIKYLLKYHQSRVKKVAIIDLDAHQGNGYERDFIGKKNIFIIDCFNPNIYPNDQEAKLAIAQQINVYSEDTDQTFLKKIKYSIIKNLNKFKPDFILYNAGTDSMENDRLGKLNLSCQGIIKRDELVFEYSLTHKIPILMVLSGGYQKQNAPVIAKSIINLTQKFNLLKKK